METTPLKKITQYRIHWELKKMYPIPELNKTIIDVTKELSDAHKKTLKEEIWDGISEKFMEKIFHMVNQNVQYALKKFQGIKHKKHEMIQKQIKELSEYINKHQSETKKPIKREVHELRRTTKIITEESE
jgi:hypothetical protein